MNKKIFLMLSLPLVLAACGEKKDGGSETFAIEDASGRTVSIDPKKRERVLCIGAGALRLYSYVGDMSLLCAAEDIDRGVAGANPFAKVSRPYYDLYATQLSSLPSCGRGGPKNQAAEAEKIISCRPDIILSEYGDVDAANNLQAMVGVPVVTLSYGPKSVFDPAVKKSLEILGKAFGREEKADALIDYISASEKELGEKAAERVAEKKSLYIGCLGNWGTQDILSTSPKFPLFAVSSIQNAVADVDPAGMNLANGIGKIDLEKLLSIDPDVIILDAAGVANFKAIYQENADIKASYDSLSAFQNGQVYLEMPFNAYYTNLEVALMDAYYAASIAYPDAYAGFDIAKKSDEISEAFLGAKMYGTIAAAEYSYGGFQRIQDVASFLAQ